MNVIHKKNPNPLYIDRTPNFDALVNVVPRQAAAVGRVLTTANHIKACSTTIIDFSQAKVALCVKIVDTLTIDNISYEQIILRFEGSQRKRIIIEEDQLTDDGYPKAGLEAWPGKHEPLEFTVDSLPCARLKGHHLFDGMMMLCGKRVHKIKAKWYEGDNKSHMNEEIKKEKTTAITYGKEFDFNVVAKNVATTTWTGRQVARYGFTKVVHIAVFPDSEGTDNSFEVIFAKHQHIRNYRENT